jgi:hypothetical protein
MPGKFFINNFHYIKEFLGHVGEEDMRRKAELNTWKKKLN